MKVSRHQTDAEMKTNSSVFTVFPTETTPLAAVSSLEDSLPTYKIWLKEDDKTKLAKSPLEGSPDLWVQRNWGEDMADCFYSVVIS